MKITNQRIRTLKNYLIGIQEDEAFYISYSEINSQRSHRAGFTVVLNEGEQVLPTVLGPVSKFNSIGRFIVHRDQPKEIVSRDYILESIHHDNATYLFGENWKELSQLSKGEILNQNLHERRFIHREQWQNEINRLFA